MNTTKRVTRAIAWLLIAAIGFNPLGAYAQTVHYHNDVAGSPLAATNEDGSLAWRQSYRPYGERMLSTPDNNKLWFHGKEADNDTGLSYFGARSYDPVLGRFMGMDPQGFDDKNLHSFNRYAYGNNNPYKFKDLDGNSAAFVLAMTLLSVAYLAYELHPMSMPVVPDNSGVAAQTGALEAAAGVFGGILGGVRMAAGARTASEVTAESGSIPRTISGETKYTVAGRKAHNAEPLEPGFERNVGIPNTRLRMDAYNKETREIIEIKPNNPRAVKQGDKQLQQYCAECDKNIGPGHTGRPVQTYDPKKYLD